MDRERARGQQVADLKVRTQAFALQVIAFADGLPRSRTSDVLGRQFLRCGTSVGANYRAAARAKSTADFTAKMAIVEEEADECGCWLTLCAQAGLASREAIESLHREADDLTAIAVASQKTARGHSR